MKRIRSLVAPLACVLATSVCVGHAVAADYSAPATNSSRDPDLARGRMALQYQDWPGAIEAFEKVVAKDPRNADAYNMLGFASRKSGKLDAAFKYYGKALAIDPKHRGALEYEGEGFLMAGKPAKAEANLATLAKLCNSSCEEHTDLKKAIESYKAGKR